MPNIQIVKIIVLNDVVQSGVAINYDLACSNGYSPKRLSEIYIKIIGGWHEESSSYFNESIKVTKITSCDNTYDLSLDKIGDLQILLIPDPCCNPPINNSNGSNPSYYNYTGVGDEFDFTIPFLIDKNVFGCYKDGLAFTIINPLTQLDETKKQVKYIQSTGQFLWSVPFQNNEDAIIQYY